MSGKIAVFLIGLGFSLFYGFKGVDIFTDNSQLDLYKRIMNGSQKFHQWWFNFLGSAVGCVVHPPKLDTRGHV